MFRWGEGRNRRGPWAALQVNADGSTMAKPNLVLLTCFANAFQEVSFSGTERYSAS